jgi:hypothetical protein
MTRRTTTAALTAATLALVLGGCHYASNPGSSSSGGSTGGHGGDVQKGGTGRPCEATFLPAGETTGISGGASAKATLWVRCLTPPTEHHLTLELQRYGTSRFNTVETRHIDKIPGPDWTTAIVSASCIPGSWRLQWSVTGTLNGIPFAGSGTGDEKTLEVHDCA